jgi:oligopeptide/dipeptide ABC transporter ATP-binding protein
MAIMLITHDLGVVAELCDRVAVMYAGQVVEEGPVEALFRQPRHPYTEGLLAAVPRPDRGSRLAVIPGTVPSATSWPAGCRFRERCRYAWGRCRDAPDLLGSSGHPARCWLVDEPERRTASRTGAGPGRGGET